MGLLDRLPFNRNSLPARVIVSYILDYVIIIVLFVGFWILDAIEPFHQHFSLRNYTIQYPFAEKERVPIPLAIFIAVACPAGVIGIYTLIIDGIFSHHKDLASRSWIAKYKFKDRLWELNCGILGLLLSSGAAFVITNALKNATGKPRPDFIARCLPKANSADRDVFGLSDDSICTQEDHYIMKDGFRSFPSGHSSSSWAGLFYLSLYLAGKLHLLDNRGEAWKVFVVITPSIGAALITVSRIMDARHHPFDVISGSLLGILCAFTAYRQYFPSLSEPWKKGRAFPIRSWGTIGGPGTAHVEREISRDEGVEPLRTGPIPLHLQSTRGINVFREQVARTDGHRHPQDPSFARHDGADSMPYSAPGVLRSRGGRRPDEFWDELSEDEHRDVELQAPAYGGDRRIAGPPETAPQSTAQPLHIAPAAPIVEPRFTT